MRRAWGTMWINRCWRKFRRKKKLLTQKTPQKVWIPKMNVRSGMGVLYWQSPVDIKSNSFYAFHPKRPWIFHPTQIICMLNQSTSAVKIHSPIGHTHITLSLSSIFYPFRVESIVDSINQSNYPPLSYNIRIDHSCGVQRSVEDVDVMSGNWYIIGIANGLALGIVC